jgi:hypothetical protein
MKRFTLFIFMSILLLMVAAPVSAALTETTYPGLNSISTVSPSDGHRGDTVTVTITGTNFTTTQGDVWLEKSGENDIEADSISSWTSGNTIVCKFKIGSSKDTGLWNVVVRTGWDPNAYIVKTNAFTISDSPAPTTIPTTAPGSPNTYGDFSVLSMSVDPPGYVYPGTPVNITYELGFTGSGDETFPSGNELLMSTDLDSARWTYSLVLDGVDAPQPSTSGRVLAVSGWVLSYPSSFEERIRVTLNGTKPVPTCPLLVQIQEVNSHNLVITPFYQYWGEDCDAGLVSRTMPAAVSPGSQFTVNIIPNEHLLADPGWKVSELIPYGFNFVSTTAFHTIQTSPSSYTFIQNSNAPFSYVLKAPAIEGPYSFSGRFTDGYKSSGTVDGDVVLNVGTKYANYLNTTTEKIERVDAQRAMNDNLLGILSNQGAGSVLENYFLGE